MDVQFSFEGDKKLNATLTAINKTASGRALRKAAKAGAEPIVKRAREKAPKRTRKLEKSIRSKFGKRRSDSVTVEIGSNLKPQGSSYHSYDYYQEHGTSRHPAQPFLRPALDEEKKKAAEETHKVMLEAVMEEVRRSGR